jgi:hypothetical protein
VPEFPVRSSQIEARFFPRVRHSILMSVKNPNGHSPQTAPLRQPRRTGCSGPPSTKAAPGTWALAPAANTQLKSDPFADPAWREASNLGLCAASSMGQSKLTELTATAIVIR